MHAQLIGHEIDHAAPNWMISLATLARNADHITIRNFKARPVDITFIKRICLEQKLSIEEWTDDALTLEKA